MSVMATPTPVMNLKRSEDLTNLNNILIGLALDNRVRIAEVGNWTLIRAAGVNSSVDANNNIAFPKGAIYGVLAFAEYADGYWSPLPYIKLTTGASIALEKVLTANLSLSGDDMILTFHLDVIDSVKTNPDTFNIKYFVLKERIE